MKHHVFITYLLHIIYITDRSSSVKAFSLTVSAMQLACIVLNVLFKAKLLAIHVPSAHLKGFGARHFLLPLVNSDLGSLSFHGHMLYRTSFNHNKISTGQLYTSFVHF